jgi:hypothetical protein
MVSGARAVAAAGTGRLSSADMPAARSSVALPCFALTSIGTKVSRSVALPSLLAAVKSPGKASICALVARVEGRDRHRHHPRASRPSAVTSASGGITATPPAPSSTCPPVCASICAVAV